MADNPMLLTRRAAISKAVTLFGATMTAAQFGLLSEAIAAISEDSPPRFLNREQFEILTTIAGLIIPETDTPGAVGAGVPHFIDMMLADWASPQRQARYAEGLKKIDAQARDAGADSFSEASTAQQTTLLRELDKQSFAEGSADHFFGELKKMVLFGYYSSETGATVELRFQRIPGDYLPCVPMDDVGRAWFWNGYSYGL